MAGFTPAQSDHRSRKDGNKISSRVLRDIWLKRLILTGPSWAMLPIRVALGIIFFAHGSQKLMGWFGGEGLITSAQIFEEPYGLSPGIFWVLLVAFAEFFGALLVLAGLFTRVGAFGLAVVMATAICKVHLGSFFNPDGMEFPLALFGACISLVVYGGGRWSIDGILLRLEPRRPGQAAAGSSPSA
ncbi:MAG: DoxX family protein [Verrucomicrobia bacterium]|nr:DoxX family protein [Verrucomicrobiota bacterium]